MSLEERLIEQQGQILNIVQQMASSPMAARDYAAITQNRYVGNAVQGPENGFMTFNRNLGHNPVNFSFNQMTSNPLVGGVMDAVLGPSMQNLFSPLNQPNPDVLYAQNRASVGLGAARNALGDVFTDRIREIPGLEDSNPGLISKFAAGQLMAGGLNEQTLQLLDRAGVTNRDDVIEGLITSGATSIGLSQYGLMGSLTRRDEISNLRNVIEQTVNADNGLGVTDVLSATTALNDPRLDLNLSDKFKGFDQATLTKTTEDLQRAKRLTGLSNTATLGLLADVYDNVIEGVLPDINDFVDRITRLENSGVSTAEFSNAVKGMRARLGAAGVKDNRVAVEAVDRALGSRQAALDMNLAAGNTEFNPRTYVQGQMDQAAREAGSGQMRVLSLIGEKIGISSTEDWQKAADANFKGYGLSPALQADLASGDFQSVYRKTAAGMYGKELTPDMLRLGATGNQSEMIMPSNMWEGNVLNTQLDFGAAASALSNPIKDLLRTTDDATRYGRYKDLLQVERLSRMDDPDERAAAAEAAGITLKDGGFYSEALGRTISPDEITNNMGWALRSLQDNFNIGRSKEQIELDRARALEGVTGKDTAKDLESATKSLSMLSDPSNLNKTSLSTRLGVLLRAGERIKGETAADFDTLSESLFTGQETDKEKAELLEKVKGQISGNETLSTVFGDMDGVDSIEGLAQSIYKAQSDKEKSLEGLEGKELTKAKEEFGMINNLISAITTEGDVLPDSANTNEIAEAIRTFFEYVKEQIESGKIDVSISKDIGASI